jgi:chorismate dehydratase
MSRDDLRKQELTNPQVRIGMVNYINTAPIYEIWKQTVNDERYTIIEEPPSVLNRMLASGKIDLGFVSSYEYCVRPHNYKILQDLSISSTGAVGSVFLFSKVPLEQLNNNLVLLSNQSETSVCLVKIILEEFYGIHPQYIIGGVSGDISHSCQAVLAIGDDALRLVSSDIYAYQFDLGEIWLNLTGLPFVFSVCVVRDSFARDNADLVQHIQESLVRCRNEGQNQLSTICRLAAPRIPMDYDRCFSYLQGLEYDLENNKCQALEKFFSILIRREEANKEALPLRFFQGK